MITGRSGVIGVLMAATMVACTTQEPQIDQDKQIREMIGKMSLEQKVQLLVGTGMHFDLPDSIAANWPQPEKTMDSAYYAMVDSIRAILPGAAGFTAAYPELGVTTQVLADGPAGLRISPHRAGDDNAYYCTAFPIATLMASSWDKGLVEKVGQAMGAEVLAYNADVLLAPGMNIQRDPLCGRNFEYYSEDPLVTGKMAAAMVNGIESNGVGTSIKHFAANNQETNRTSVNTIVSERALREIYLRGFEIAVKEAQPWTVMSSYNKINGVYTAESHDLLTKVLRDDWGFEGYVMTDWTGGSDPVAMMKAGNDVLMPGNEQQIRDIIKAVKEGSLNESVLDENITRVLRIMMKSPKQNGIETGDPNLEAHAKVARMAASEGMILFKNQDAALPLGSEIKNVAVFGTTSYEFISGGTGSGDVNEAYTVSLIDGLKNGGLTIDENLAITYNRYIKEARANMGRPKNWLAALMGAKEPVPEMEVTPALAKSGVENADVALITIGRNSGEGGDREPIEGDFYLTNTEKMLVKNVSDAFHAVGKKVVVVLNIGGAIEVASWRDQPDAILCAWQPGQEAGNAVVDVLTGKVTPSGKLAVTFPIQYEDAPSSSTFPGVPLEAELNTNETEDDMMSSFMQRVPWEVVYEEDIYVGYRYYTTFDVPVAYEFGYGLSYTNFEYSNLTLSSDKFTDAITATVDVTNTGSAEGKEVVQVYLSAPAQKIEKPSQVLVDFGKTASLAPGATETLSFTIEAMDLCSFDEASSSWNAEAGTYKIMVGSSSKNILLSGEFSLAEDRVVEKVSKSLTPTRTIDKMSSRR